MKTVHLSIIISSALAVLASVVVILYFQTNVTTIQFSDNPREIVANPETGRIYVVANPNFEANSSLYVISPTIFGYKTIDSIPTGKGSIGVAVNSKTNRIYVTNPFSNSITVIDGYNDNVMDTIKAGTKPVEVAVNPDTNLVYVSNWDPPFGVTVINGTTNKIIANITNVPGASYGIAVNPTTNKVYVNNFVYARYNPNVLSVIDCKTNKVIANVTLAIGLHAGLSTVPDAFRVLHVVVNPVTNMVYATNHWLPKISVLDGYGSIVNEINQNNYPETIAVNPKSNLLYLSDGRNISIFDGRTYETIKTVNLNEPQYEIALDSTSNRLFVSQPKQISIINNIDS